MIWNPNTMLIGDVLRPFGKHPVTKAGLRSIGRKGDKLILTYPDGTVKEIAPGEEVKLPWRKGLK